MHPKSLANLKRKLTPNAPGISDKDSQVVSVRLHVDDVAAIAELSGDRSYHIRQAVKNYLTDWDDLRASSLVQAQTQESLPSETGWNDGEPDSDWSDRIEHGEYDSVTDTIHSGYLH